MYNFDCVLLSVLYLISWANFGFCVQSMHTVNTLHVTCIEGFDQGVSVLL